ncbi:alanine racemase [Rhodococcus fascians]|nr:alanine racemase [Rhodococcus fascians]MBY4238660.1 alanine racemase [Rhodococcus fascians]MBY4254751.1 alanine racemase [Rhodococcus fascians]MBY4270015.1 alanine racemase [Rhodococcus fascians]
MKNRRAELTIDLANLRHNISLLTDIANESNAETMVVVKSDAYGHGLTAVARAACAAGVSWLGTCDIASALTLRRKGIGARLFSWLDEPGADYAEAIAREVDLSVSSVEELQRVAWAAVDAGRTASVHLKIDTGMWRNGCPPHEWETLVRRASGCPSIRVHSIWSHLACADDPQNPATDIQAQRFSDAYGVARSFGLEPKRHLANSAATLTRPDLHFDMVRTGIAVYGLNPVVTSHDLRPVMTFRSSVVLTKRIPGGESVSYGHTWTASRDSTLALVPVGYADGIPRSLSGKLRVLLNGKTRPVIGRISMDQIVVDCQDDDTAVGDEVVLFGGGANGEPTAREWATNIGTIDYEIVTGMYRPRVKRCYQAAAPSSVDR